MTLFSLRYLTLAGVVAVANIAGVTPSGLPFAIIALSALALAALMASAVLAVDGLARAFTSGGIQHD